MVVELLVSDEFARWFEWLVAADPDAAREIEVGVDAYASDPDVPDEPMVLDVCISPPPRGMAFVAAHLVEAGAVLIASGAEVGESVRRCTTLVRRAEKVVRRFERGSLGVLPWGDVRSYLHEEAGGAHLAGRACQVSN